MRPKPFYKSNRYPKLLLKCYAAAQKQRPSHCKRILRLTALIYHKPESMISIPQQTLTPFITKKSQNWQAAMGLITFSKAKDFKQAAEQTNLLTNPDSPLWQIMQNEQTAVKNAGAKAPMQDNTLPNAQLTKALSA